MKIEIEHVNNVWVLRVLTEVERDATPLSFPVQLGVPSYTYKSEVTGRTTYLFDVTDERARAFIRMAQMVASSHERSQNETRPEARFGSGKSEE